MKASIISLIVCGLISLTASAASYFNAPQEFPDLFLSIEQRANPTLTARDLSQRQVLMNNALASVYQRLTVPLVQNDGQLHNTRIFPYLQKLAEEKAQGEFKIFAAGGVVRSSIAFLYAEMYQQWLQDPQFDSTSFLKNFAQQDTDLPGLQVRGIGSDFDILIQDPSGENGQLKEEILAVINSAETQFGLTTFKDDLKKTMVTIGDVKGYSEQMARATAQGGSTLDFLTFDISEGKLLEPQKFPNTIADLLRGYLTYAAPASANAVEDLAKQTVRGLRPLLELPFVRYKDESVLRQELKILETSTLSDRAAEQITKLARNSRFAGAHNRFYRGATGSLEQVINHTLQQKGLLSEIPRYIDFNPLHLRGADRGLNGFPSSLLMNREKFDLLTQNGTLYHGTPNIGAGLSIMRSGLFESSLHQGRAVFGRGAYSSADPATALTYANGGVVFRVQVKNDPNVNIIDWEQIKNDPFIKNLESECQNKNLDVFEVLSQKYHIDIIINHYILIENQDAISLPSSFGDLLESYRYRVLATTTSWNDKMEALRFYTHFSKYAEDLGVSIVPVGNLVGQLLSTGQCSISQILQLFKSSHISLDIFSFQYVQWIKKALLQNFASAGRTEQALRAGLILTLSKAEKDARQLAVSDAELDILQPVLSQELRLRLISLKSQPSKSDIDMIRTLAAGPNSITKLMALPILYSTTGDSAPLIEFLHSMSVDRKSSLPATSLRAFFELTTNIRNPSAEVKKAVLGTVSKLGTQQLLFSGIFSSSQWFTDLNEILMPLQNAKNKDLFYTTILRDPRWQGRAELDRFLENEIKHGDRLKVFRALKTTEVFRQLSQPQQVFSLLVADASLNYSTDLAEMLLRIPSFASNLENVDTLILGALKAGKAIPEGFLNSSLSVKKLPHSFQFLEQNPDYLRLKVPENTMRALIHIEPDVLDLAAAVPKFDTLTASSILWDVSLLDRPALQRWLKLQIQSKPNKVIFEILTDKQVIRRADWVSLAALYANQKKEHRENILLSPNVRQSQGLLEAFEKATGADQNLNQKNLLKIKEFRAKDFELAAEIPIVNLSGNEMGRILTNAKSLKGTAKFNQVLESYLNDSRFKLSQFPAITEVFDSLPLNLQKRSLLLMTKDSQRTFSIFQNASSAYTVLSHMPDSDITTVIQWILKNNKLTVLLKQKDARTEPFRTLLPKFLKVAEKTKNLEALSYFFESQPALTDAKSLATFATLDQRAAIKHIFQHQRFDASSLTLLRTLAAKKQQTYLLLESILKNPHFPNRTAWLENMTQSPKGFEILMRLVTSKQTQNIFSPEDPAFESVMLSALPKGNNAITMSKALLELRDQPSFARALFNAWAQKLNKFPQLTQIFQKSAFLKMHPDLATALAPRPLICRQMFL